MDDGLVLEENVWRHVVFMSLETLLVAIKKIEDSIKTIASLENTWNHTC